MKKLWIAFIAVVVISFAILGWAGYKIYHEKPPIPGQVVTTDGQIMIPEGAISIGQNVWQAMGGMQLGSIWGHGSYVATDWSADWLHRECVFILNQWAQADFNQGYDFIHAEKQAALRERLKNLMRTNSYDPNRDQLVLDPIRKEAFEANLRHYQDVFMNGNAEYAIPANTVRDIQSMRQLASFFFWSSWAASTNRVDDNITYTSNWPHEPLIDNKPTSDSIIWTGFSILTLLAGISLLVVYYVRQKHDSISDEIPLEDPLMSFKATPSQMATIRYFWVVAGLVSIANGIGCHSRSLWGRGAWFLWYPGSQVASVCRRPDLAHTTRYFLDRDIVVGGGSVYRPACFRF